MDGVAVSNDFFQIFNILLAYPKGHKLINIEHLKKKQKPLCACDGSSALSGRQRVSTTLECFESAYIDSVNIYI